MSDQDTYQGDEPYDSSLDPYPEQAALDAQLAQIVSTRADVASQARELEGEIGSLRSAQARAFDVARTASVELAISQGGDFYAPDVGQQVAPDGTVTYDFDAHLHARGVDLDAASTASPPGDRLIRWFDAAGGLAADIEAYTLPAGDRVVKLGAYGVVSGAGRAVLQGRSPGGTNAELHAEYDDGTATLRALAVAASKFATIIDSLGRSSFLQLDQTRNSIVGFTTAGFNGGSASAFQTVAHSLGAAPFVIATINAGSSSGTVGACVATVFDITASSFMLGARTIAGNAPPAGTLVTINYLAWA